MAQEATYGISVDSKVNTINITAFVVQSVIIQNYSGDNVIFDNTIDPLLVIPPGVTAPININHLIYTIRLRTATNTTGYVFVTFSDSQQDISHAPALQQLPGTVTIGGNVGIPSAVTVNQGPGSWNTADATVASLITALNALVTTLNGYSSNIQNYTNIITGMLPGTTTPFTVASETVHQIVVPAAVPGFRLQTLTTGTGRLNVYVSNAQGTVYLLRDQPIAQSINGKTPVNKQFPEPLAMNDIINVAWNDANAVLSAIVRF